MTAEVALHTLQDCSAIVSAAIGSAKSPWWSVVVTPVATASLSLIIAWIAISFERRKTINQEIIKKRISIYDIMAPKLNAIYCFQFAVGRWKEFTPKQMISNKRELDYNFNIYQPLFSDKIKEKYYKFIGACFETYTGAGKPARLRVDQNYLRSQWGSDWNSDWDEDISPSDKMGDRKYIRMYYIELMDQFALDMGVRHNKNSIRSKIIRFFRSSYDRYAGR